MPRRRKQDNAAGADQAASEEQQETSSRAGLRAALIFTAWTVGIVTLVFGAAWLLFQGEQFLSSDSRFQLPSRGPTAEDASITITGARNSSEAAIRAVFEKDRGRSLVDVDLEKRRLELRTIEWVRDATVRRVWPNQIAVEIQERAPVAFIRVPTGAPASQEGADAYKPMLIDSDGIVLEPRGPVPKNLPLLAGVSARGDVEKRKARILLMMRMLDALGEFKGRVDEVDVGDPDNLRIGFRTPGPRVILILGNEKFHEHVKNFADSYERIKDRLTPDAVLDISLTGRITQADSTEVSKD